MRGGRAARRRPPGGLRSERRVHRHRPRLLAARGVAERIELRLAPAADTLAALLDGGAAGTFDLAFIDADKTGYAGYYEQCLRLVRSGGLIVVDNVLWNGRVLDAAGADADTRAIQAFNRALHGDDRIDLSLVPIGDGLTLARKR